MFAVVVVAVAVLIVALSVMVDPVVVVVVSGHKMYTIHNTEKRR